MWSGRRTERIFVYKMACSFAVRRLLAIFVLYSSLTYHCGAEKEFLFEKGDLWGRKSKTTSNPGSSRLGIGWSKSSDDTSATSRDIGRADNWFYLQSIPTKEANCVFVEVEYALPDIHCNESDCGLFLRTYQAMNEDSIADVSVSSYNANRIGIKTTKVRKVTMIHFGVDPGMFLSVAVQAKGVSAIVYNISVYYYYCPRMVSGPVLLNRTSAPSGRPKRIIGRCLKPLSHREGEIKANCYHNGTWEKIHLHKGLCPCKAGEEFENTTASCIPCKKNYFGLGGGDACQKCKMNTITNGSGSVTCSCPAHHYRNSDTETCRTIPPSPKNLTYTRLQNNRIRLRWERPSISEGYNDLRYSVKCRCGPHNCVSCKDISIGIEGVHLIGTNITISRLLNGTEYVFIVTSVNNVSKEAKQWKSTNCSVKLAGPVDATLPDTNTLVTTLNTNKPVDTNLPSRAAGDVNTNVKQPKNTKSPAVALGPYIGAAIGGVLLILIIIIVLLYKSKRMKKGKFEEEILLTGNELAYVDPARYGNPEKAVGVFAKEIDRRQVKLEGVIGEGEFAKVHKGLFCRLNEPEIPVAVKVLKPGSSAKNREDFLTEAAVMGQFKDMNIVALEGVVTISHPVMIITEFMHNGALSTFLAENKTRLCELDLLNMAKGIASGMKYLARMRFVHRDLAARNVLVNENWVCKVADFGLTRELEESCQGEYVTQGGKIPIRWTAPEAYKHRRFTTASDVWSYGIVLWEIMSFAERPYGSWDNYMVMDQVNANYRLTPPMNCPRIVHQLMRECWKADRNQRPAFADIVEMLKRWISNPYLLKDYEYVTEKTRMADRKSCIASSIREYLEGIRMERYVDNFVDFGYTELYQIQHFNDNDLVGIGVPLVGHRNKIMKSLSLRSERDRLLPAVV